MLPPEHNTRQATIDRLDEAVTRLNQGQSSLAQNLAQIQATMSAKFESILERLATMTILTSPSPSWPHMKLDVPHFDGRDPVEWIFKAL